MNQFLQDIFAQPAELQRVLDDLAGPHRGQLRAAAALMKSARRIVVTSMGSAYFSAWPVAFMLGQVHPNVHLVETEQLLREAPFFEETLYIIPSRSGESGEIARFAKLIRQRGGRLLAITMTPASTLATNADLVLHDISSFDGLICTKAYTTLVLTGLLAVSEMLGKLDQALVDNLAANFQWMERHKQQALDHLAAMPALRDAAGVTFLSQGAGLALAGTAALWTEEAARVRASYNSFGNFHHGPVEQVDERFVGCWIDLSPDARSRELYAEIVSHRPTLVTVSLPGVHAGAFEVPAAALPEAYRVIPAALVAQLLAYQVAVGRGCNPGEMRYLNWLVK